MSWSNDFIGIPYAPLGRDRSGADCWGLVLMVLAAQGRPVPDYGTDYADRAAMARLIGAAKASPTWIATDRPAPLDLVVFRRAGLDSHIGIIADRCRMLHVDRARPSRLERFDLSPWTDRAPSFWTWTGEVTA